MGHAICASASGARIYLSEEECALSMVQRVFRHVALKGVQRSWSTEEYARGMALRSSDAAWRVAEIKLSKEEYVRGMEQRGRENDAALKDARIMQGLEEFASGTGQTSNQKLALMRCCPTEWYHQQGCRSLSCGCIASKQFNYKTESSDSI